MEICSRGTRNCANLEITTLRPLLSNLARFQVGDAQFFLTVRKNDQIVSSRDGDPTTTHSRPNTVGHTRNTQCVYVTCSVCRIQWRLAHAASPGVWTLFCHCTEYWYRSILVYNNVSPRLRPDALSIIGRGEREGDRESVHPNLFASSQPPLKKNGNSSMIVYFESKEGRGRGKIATTTEEEESGGISGETRESGESAPIEGRISIPIPFFLPVRTRVEAHQISISLSSFCEITKWEEKCTHPINILASASLSLPLSPSLILFRRWNFWQGDPRRCCVGRDFTSQTWPGNRKSLVGRGRRGFQERKNFV